MNAKIFAGGTLYGVVKLIQEESTEVTREGKKFPLWFLNATCDVSEYGDFEMLRKSIPHRVENPNPTWVKHQYGLG
ncbi:MAG: hypothetical protein K6G36_02165 [Candidatus Saccharibacteria bacterium]|nr:hypothetical protein [Candidatus Saccharibacteria bacterium]